MFKNPWFTLVIGLMLGLALGYVLAELCNLFAAASVHAF